MTTEYVYDGQRHRGIGSVGNGDLVVVVLDDTYVFVPEHDTVADVAEFEAAGAPRAVFTATVELIDRTWFAMPDSTPVIDLSEVDNRGGVVVARQGATDADRKLVQWSPDPGGADAAYEPWWPNGILQDDVDTATSELAAHIASTQAHGLPSIAEATAGQVLGVAIDPDTDEPYWRLFTLVGVGVDIDVDGSAGTITYTATGGGGPTPEIPADAYLTEDGTSYYATEDGASYYAQEGTP